MYQAFYNSDPEHHTPPIPTTQVIPPLTQQRLRQLCYSNEEPTEEEQTATVSRLLHAVHALEAAVLQGDPVRGVVEGSGGSPEGSAELQWMGEYMLKREFSEGSHHVFGIAVPKLIPDTDQALDQHRSLSNMQEAVCIPSADDSDTVIPHPASRSSSSGSLNNASTQTCCYDSNGTLQQQRSISNDAVTTANKVQSSSSLSLAQALLHVPAVIAKPLTSLIRLCAQSWHADNNHNSEAQQQPALLPDQACSPSVSVPSTVLAQDSCPVSASQDDNHSSSSSSNSSSSNSSSSSCRSNSGGNINNHTTSASTGSSNPLMSGHASEVQYATSSGQAAQTHSTDHKPTAQTHSTDHNPTAQSHGTDGQQNQVPEPQRIAVPSYVWQPLIETAGRLLKESCGESWLLQPKIADMTRLEYRVYMLGGASAVRFSYRSSCLTASKVSCIAFAVC